MISYFLDFALVPGSEFHTRLSSFIPGEQDGEVAASMEIIASPRSITSFLFVFLASRTFEVHCETVTEGLSTLKPCKFKIAYDKLVLACGAEASTFGINGVLENAIFLREVQHAQEIRRKLLNLMLSAVPGIGEEEKKRLLHCVVVGGGPTGVEFSGELSDFIMKDVRQRYAHVKDDILVTLIEDK